MAIFAQSFPKLNAILININFENLVLNGLIFVCLGFFVLFFLAEKRLFQEYWRSQIGCNDVARSHSCGQFNRCCPKWKMLGHIHRPRRFRISSIARLISSLAHLHRCNTIHYGGYRIPPFCLQLHNHACFLMSIHKIGPWKHEYMLKVQLQAAVLGIWLSRFVSTQLKSIIHSVQSCCDNTAIFSWIDTSAEKKLYIALILTTFNNT